MNQNKILPLGELLKREGKITDEQLIKALEEQRKTGDRLGHTLVKLGFITEDDLINALEKQFKLPCIKINPKIMNPNVVKLIPENICRKYRLIPFMLLNNKLTVAATDPYNLNFMNEIKFTTDYDVEIVLSPESSVMNAINFFFGEKDYNYTYDEKIDGEKVKGISSVKMLDLILLQAYNMNAREIHLQFFENEFIILFITPSRTIKSTNLPADYYPALSMRIKFIAKLDLEEKNKFQEGLIKYSIYGNEILIRILIFPHLKGENIVLKFA